MMSDASPAVRAAQRSVIAQRRRMPTSVPVAVDLASTTGASYAGLVTRAIAFALDGAVVNGCALVVGVVVALGLSVLHLPEEVDAIVAATTGLLWVLWSVAYFAFFWSANGQTPGNRVMRIQVIDRGGAGPLHPLRSAARFGAVILAALPLLAGILMMLWDARRRCLQDRIARTVVVDVPVPGAAVPARTAAAAGARDDGTTA
jgi:uncharacterized RDD family membrane protein YckC